MKKSQRPFSFEVKRSKLSSQRKTTFQRYLQEPQQAAIVGPSRARASDLEIEETSAKNPPRREQRVLPSMLGERAWRNDDPAPNQAVPEISIGAEAEPETEIVLPDEDPEIPEELIDSRPAVSEDSGTKMRRHRRKAAADDLPRGERWKRRLPQRAW